MNLDAYFDRIDYQGSREPSLATLQKIHRAHLQAVPFENLDIHIPRPIQLNREALFKKIVTEHRGGFCFEQNGFFAYVLQDLGFEVSMLSAQVYSQDFQSYGIPGNHMTLHVTVEGRSFLADVGFGASFWDPVPLRVQADPFAQKVGDFWFEESEGLWHFYSRELGGAEKHLRFRFTLEPQRLESFEDACRYMQTSPETHFTQKRMCSRWSAEGRLTLSEGRLIETFWDGSRRETETADEERWHAFLRERFQVDVRTQKPDQTNS